MHTIINWLTGSLLLVLINTVAVNAFAVPVFYGDASFSATQWQEGVRRAVSKLAAKESLEFDHWCSELGDSCSQFTAVSQLPSVVHPSEFTQPEFNENPPRQFVYIVDVMSDHLDLLHRHLQELEVDAHVTKGKHSGYDRDIPDYFSAQDRKSVNELNKTHHDIELNRILKEIQSEVNLAGSQDHHIHRFFLRFVKEGNRLRVIWKEYWYTATPYNRDFEFSGMHSTAEKSIEKATVAVRMALVLGTLPYQTLLKDTFDNKGELTTRVYIILLSQNEQCQKDPHTCIMKFESQLQESQNTNNKLSRKELLETILSTMINRDPQLQTKSMKGAQVLSDIIINYFRQQSPKTEL